MGRKLPPLNALKAFEATARHLNFNKAAQELCVTQGAISRQIQVLERYFGTQLFRRTARAIEMTEEGRILFPSVRHALDEIEKASRWVDRADQTRVLTISTSPTFALKWLFPRLFRFSEREPDIEVRTISTVQAVDFSRGDVDLAIRVRRLDPSSHATGQTIGLAPGEDANIKAVRLMEDRPVPVCSPDFLERHGPIRSVADIDEDMLIHMASRLNSWADFNRAEKLPPPAQRKQVYGHFFLGIEAALRGMGVALVPYVHVHDDIGAGRLVVPFPGPEKALGAYFFLCRSGQWSTPKIQAFRKWLIAESQRWIAETEMANNLPVQLADTARPAGALALRKADHPVESPSTQSIHNRSQQ